MWASGLSLYCSNIWFRLTTETSLYTYNFIHCTFKTNCVYYSAHQICVLTIWTVWVDKLKDLQRVTWLQITARMQTVKCCNPSTFKVQLRLLALVWQRLQSKDKTIVLLSTANIMMLNTLNHMRLIEIPKIAVSKDVMKVYCIYRKCCIIYNEGYFASKALQV